MRVITKFAACPIMVASAAPVMPQWKTKMNKGSSMMFIIAPASIESIAHAGLPSARIAEFIMLQRMNIGIIASTTSKYSIAYARVFSDVSKNVKIGTLKQYMTSIITMPDKNVSVMLAPIAL